MKPRYVIFDIDGVVVDSEPLHFDVLKALLPDRTSTIVPENLVGLSLEETLLKIGIDARNHAEMAHRITDAYKARLEARYLRPGIRAFIRQLAQKQIAFGFVSTAPREICLANIAILGLEQKQRLISGDDTERTKPHPDPYLAMLRCLGAHPEQAIAIEDTDLGIQAATAAGIRQVFGWPHALSGAESYAKAHKVIHSLDDIDVFEGPLPNRLR